MASVLFLHSTNDLYGASRVLLGDVEIVRALGHAVRVVVPFDGPLSAPLRGTGADVAVRPMQVLRRSRPASALSWPWRLPVTLRPDEVTVLWTLSMASYVPVLLAARARVVLSVHEIMPGVVGSALGRLAARSRGLVMVNSAATRRWMESVGTRADRLCLAYPVAPSWRPLPPPEANGALRLLVAARVSARKGHLQALEAVARLRMAGVPAHLTLAGAPFPGQEHHLERLLARVARVPWATYAGEVNDLRQLLADHHVLLVPSVAPESFGLVALEAWAAGRRVVAPDEGGMAEAARMADGVLYRPRDLTSTVAVLGRVAAEPALVEPTRSDAPAATLCTARQRVAFWDEALGRRGDERD